MAKLFGLKSATQLYELLTSNNPDAILEYMERIEFHPTQVALLQKSYLEIVDEGGWVHLPEFPGVKKFADEIYDSAEYLDDFIAHMPAHRLLGQFIAVFNHGGGEVTAEFGWLDSVAGRVLWDRWQGHVENPVQAFVNVGIYFDHRDYQCIPKAKVKPAPPMYQFHPERYKTYRDYADSVGNFYKHSADSKTGLITLDGINKLASFVYEEMNNRSMNYPRRLTLGTPSPSLIADGEMHLAMSYGRFVKSGRQIIDFPASLVGLFSETDVENIPMKAIKMPFASQYLHFGPSADLEIAPGWLVDGAYVESRGDEGDMRFTITAIPKDPSLSALWYVYPEPMESQDFIETFRDSDLSHAIDALMDIKVKELEAKIRESGGDITDKVKEEFSKKGEEPPKDLRLFDVSPQNAQTRLEREQRQYPIYRAAMRLVVNALCYLTAYQDDITEVWPKGTPRGLMEKTGSPDEKVSTKARSKLSSMGYVPIYYCGKHFEEQRELAGLSESKHIRAHWRRGHWRNQAHGTGFTLRKLIWVMPVLVSAEHQEDDIAGHLYLVR